MKWLLIRLSWLGHRIINPIAWKFAGAKTPEHWLWRLNNWVAILSVDDYIYRKTGKTRKDWEKESKNGRV